MAHSILAPSSAHIWGAPNGCTGWVKMSQQYPNDAETEDSREGSAAHEAASIMINCAAFGLAHGLEIGGFMSNGVTLNSEMYQAAEMYCNYVQPYVSKLNASPDFVLIERSLPIPSIHAECFGTSDLIVYDRDINELHIFDFKYGYEAVEAFQNWQGISYVAAAVDCYEINGLLDQMTKVFIHIIQPRAIHREGPIRVWRTRADILRGEINTLRMNARKALSDDAECRTGPHCKHCTARHACPAALKGGARLYEAASAPVPFEISNESLGVQYAIILRAIKHLESLKDAIGQQVQSKIRAGDTVPGWGVETVMGRKKWVSNPAEVIELGDALGFDLRKIDTITPTQAIAKGMQEDVVNAMSERPSNGVQVVQVNLDKVKRVFSNE